MPGEVLALDTNSKDGKKGILASSWATVTAGSRLGARGPAEASAGADGVLVLGAVLPMAHGDK